MFRIQNMRPLAFKLIPWEFFEKLIILSKMDKNIFFEKCVLKLCRTAMIKPRQIERSGFFLLDHNGQTWVYWSQVHRIFGCGEKAILWWRRMIARELGLKGLKCLIFKYLKKSILKYENTLKCLLVFEISLSFTGWKNEKFWECFLSNLKPLYLGQILTDWALVFCKHPHFFSVKGFCNKNMGS